ncbi:MAG: S8 family serine peptidase [Pseudomonadota bacterium]
MRLLLILLLVAAAMPESACADESAVGEWVIVMTDSRPERRRGWSSGVGYTGTYSYADDPELKRLARRLARDFPVTVTRQWPIRSLSVHCVVVRIDRDAEATLAALRSDKRVEWVQPLNEFQGLSQQQDPYRHLQASLDTLNVAPLHNEFSGQGIRIVMVDSGVEADHPDLQHALADVIDFVGQPAGGERHGTGVAGVMVAHGANGQGISGVAPGAELYAYRGCWEADDGITRCNSLTLSLALDHAIDKQPHVVNLSLTGPSDPLLDRLVARLLEQGAVVVTAHDKQRGEQRFPSPAEGVLVVHDGSRVTTDALGGFYAPGQAVLTAQPGHAYDFMAGSSLAAAHVSGVLALLLEAHPSRARSDSGAALLASLRSSPGGWSIDACLALHFLDSRVHCDAVNAVGN